MSSEVLKTKEDVLSFYADSIQKVVGDKYIITDEFIGGLLLAYRIVSIKRFGDVEIGEVGGYVTSSKCLSATDESWIGPYVVASESEVKNDSVVTGNVSLCGSTVDGSMISTTGDKMILLNSTIIDSYVNGAGDFNSSRIEQCDFSLREVSSLSKFEYSDLERCNITNGVFQISSCSLYGLSMKDDTSIGYLTLNNVDYPRKHYINSNHYQTVDVELSVKQYTDKIIGVDRGLSRNKRIDVDHNLSTEDIANIIKKINEDNEKNTKYEKLRASAENIANIANNMMRS